MGRDRKSKITLNPPSPDSWRISKKQVVCANLANAIRLFLDGQYIAAHVLAGAARDVLRGLAKESGVKTFWEEAKIVVVEEYQDAFLDLMSADYNFFKHAGRDARVTRDRYQPEVTSSVIFEACVDFKKLFPETYIETATFIAWTCLWRPNLVKAGHEGFFDALNEQLEVEPNMTLEEAIVGFRQFLKNYDEFPLLQAACPSLLEVGSTLHTIGLSEQAT